MKKYFPRIVLLTAVLVAMMVMAPFAMTADTRGIQNADILDDGGARPWHWQPGQAMVVFWLPESSDYATYIGNITSNVTSAKRKSWTRTCEAELGEPCRLVNLVWLDNPRTYEWETR